MFGGMQDIVKNGVRREDAEALEAVVRLLYSLHFRESIGSNRSPKTGGLRIRTQAGEVQRRRCLWSDTWTKVRERSKGR